MTTFNASLKNLTALLLQSCDCSCYVSRPTLAPPLSDCRNTLIYAHTILRTLPTYVISLISLPLPAPKAGDLVKLIVLHTRLFLKFVI